MKAKKLLIVVDDNIRFAIHVWRYLTRAMEVGFDDAAMTALDRTSPDGLLRVVWHDPQPENFAAFKALCETSGAELWCVLDVRGVKAEHGTGPRSNWLGYYDYLLPRTESARRICVVSSYGDRDLPEGPAVHPKSLDSLRKLARDIGVSPRRWSTALRPERDARDVNVLVTGAGFELKEAGASGMCIGCPDTSSLLRQIRIDGKIAQPLAPRGTSTTIFPLLVDCDDVTSAAAAGNLDAYWDAIIEYIQTNHKANAAQLELKWREAFRRALLEHDYGHLRQSLAAAELDFDYWLTTNYTRFSDRAIDRLANALCERSEPQRDWRTITTEVEARSVTASDHDLAEHHRVMMKLHGDIGHVWTMALAGRDKQEKSAFEIKPQLHHVYSLASASLSATLRRRKARTCTWHVIGHGLYDTELVKLIARVIEQGSKVAHKLVYVTPTHDEAGCFEKLKERFKVAGDLGDTVRRETDALESASLHVRIVACSALQYMTEVVLVPGGRGPLDPPAGAVTSTSPATSS